MSFLVGKKLLNLNLFKFSKTLANLVIYRGIITQNEQDWIKENSKNLLERVKNEKPVELNIKKTSPQLFFDKSTQLKDADNVIKKILSLEYASRDDFKRYENHLIEKEFQRLPNEQNSLEIQIALHTMNIHRMLKNLEDSNGKNKTVEFFLYRQIHRRDRLMLQLFHKDNKRYRWLKDKLNLNDYELIDTHPYKRITRYEKFIAETKKATREKRLSKLDQLRSDFENRKKHFLVEKSQALKEIQQEIKKLGFDDIQFPQN